MSCHHLLLDTRPRADLVQPDTEVDCLLVPVRGLGDAPAVLYRVAVVLRLLQRLKRSTVVRAPVQQDAFKGPIVAVQSLLARYRERLEAQHRQHRHERATACHDG
jgi:hypothetical protein